MALYAIGDLHVSLSGEKPMDIFGDRWADHTGKIKESINAVIMRDGEEESDYKCFSGGEQARLVLSTILTFQELINQKSTSGGFGLSMIDEILDQTDSMGLSNLLHCLNVNPVSQSSIFLISQVNIEGSREERMRVVKKDGISYIAD